MIRCGSALIIGWTVRGWRLVVHSIFVLVGGRGWAGRYFQNAKCRAVFRHADFSRHHVEGLRQSRLIPHSQGVTSGWNLRNHHFALAIGNSEVGRIQSDYDRAHFSVNVAENVRDPRTIEAY